MLADTVNAVGLARLHVTDVLSRRGVHPDSIETVKLLVSELATNAVMHPNGPEVTGTSCFERRSPQTFEIALEIINGVIRLSVWDRDVMPPQVKQAGPEATSGRGSSSSMR